MLQNACEVLVCVNGKPVREYTHKQKTFLEGRPGSQYTLKLKNHSGNRVIAVISVDGINVISGEPATGDGAGYIIGAYDSIDVKGFRKDMDSVGAFKFCKKEQSYCNDTKETKNNNGVIGIIVINEKVEPYRGINICATYTDAEYEQPRHIEYEQLRSCSPHRAMYIKTPSASSAGDVQATYTTSSNTLGFMDDADYSSPVKSTLRSKRVEEPEPSFSVGTTWGNEIKDKTTLETFKRGSTRTEMEFYYGSKKDLKKMGVSFEKKPKVSFPSAFGKFAKPPKNWSAQ